MQIHNVMPRNVASRVEDQSNPGGFNNTDENNLDGFNNASAFIDIDHDEVSVTVIDFIFNKIFLHPFFMVYFLGSYWVGSRVEWRGG